jgi:iron(III) transport system permease protein
MTVTVTTAPARTRPKRAVLGLVITLIVALLVLPPIWTLFDASISPEGNTSGFTLSNFSALLNSKGLTEASLNSLIFSFSSMVLSLALGGSVAWLVERTDVPFKNLAWLTTIVSLGTPFILYVAAWVFLLGRAGPVNDIYRLISGDTAALLSIHTMYGMILVEGLLWSPLAFLLLSSTFRAANAEMEEAARMSGASISEAIRLISLKLARPAVLALALFIFILNLEAFEVPALVGMPGGINILTTEIYRSVKEVPPRMGYASAFSVVMLVLVSILLYFYGRISKQADRYASITGKGYRPRPLRLGKARWWCALIIVLNFTLVLLLPLVAMIWIASMKFLQPIRLSAFKSFTADNFASVFSSPFYAGLVFNTLLVAAVSATLTMVLTLIAGWLAARRKKYGRVVDQLIVIPLIFPGIVLGVAMLELALGAPFKVYGTLWLIGLAFVIHYSPFGMRYTYAGVLQIHAELEHAAAVSGANTFEILYRIVTPLLLPALASGWLFIFLLASKEMSMPLLLAGPKSQTISVAMFDLWGNGQLGEVAALGLLWAALMTLFGVAFYVVMRRQSATTFGD